MGFISVPLPGPWLTGLTAALSDGLRCASVRASLSSLGLADSNIAPLQGNISHATVKHYEPPYLVYEEGWQGMHVVALGIGRYGEEGGEGYAWQVKSFVRSVGFVG